MTMPVSTTTEPRPARATDTPAVGPRVAPLSGLLAVLAVVTGLALDNFPNAGVGDTGVATWFATHGTTRWFVSGGFIAMGGTALLAFTAALAARAEALPCIDGAPVARRLVPLAGTAWAVLTMVGGAIWLSVPMALRMFEAKPSHEVVLMAGPAYAMLVSVCAFGAAALAAALTAVSRRTGLLPRWLTRLGYPAAVLMLTNVLLPMAVITLWYGAVSVALARRTAPTPAD